MMPIGNVAAAILFLAAAVPDRDPQGETRPSQGPTLRAASGRGVTIEEGDFRLQMRNRIQAQWSFTDVDEGQDVQSFRMRRLRTTFSGTAFTPDLSWTLNMEWVQSTPVKDAFLDYTLVRMEDGGRLAVRGGQMKTLYGKSSTGTAARMMLIERDIATDTFSGGRSRGVLFHGRHAEGGKLHWHAGAFNSDTANAFPGRGEARNNADNRLSYTAGVRVDPMGDLGDTGYAQGDLGHSEDLKATFGANLWVGRERLGNTAAGAPVDILAVNLNAAAKLAGFHAMAEFYHRNDDAKGVTGGDASSLGYSLQGSYSTEREPDGGQWGFAARYAAMTLDDGIPGGPGGMTGYSFPFLGMEKGAVREVTLGVTRFFKGHDFKAQGNTSWIQTDPDAGSSTEDWVFRLQVTVQI